MEFSSSNITKILIFSQKKAFLIFLEMEPYTFQPKIKKQKRSTPRKLLTLQEMKTPINFLYFSQKRAIFLILFKKVNLSYCPCFF